ncbi:uncharacterized protein LOC133832752 [Humulus lupulus]|uniref:uncharacterized protein LOC133832752 n=1 Tax=Humulus lupulus TaxID=3486 RepID=UPI002B40C4BF|nr:uncharacterized protein LOC133832752 [Humulus lupulus]
MLNNRPQGNFPSNTVVNPKENCQAISLRNGKQVEQPSVQKSVVQNEELGEKSDTNAKGVTEDHQGSNKCPPFVDDQPVRVPYPQRLIKTTLDKQFSKFLEVFKKLHINIPFAKALEQMPSYVKFMKEILSKKRKMEDYEMVALTEECSSILQRKLPQNLRDPGSFTIPCTIGKFECKHALCDLGASINLMPLSVFRRLGLGEASPTTVTLQLADRSIKHPRGLIEDVLVTVDKFIFPADFIVLDMEEDENGEEVVFNVFKALKFANVNDSCFKVDMVEKAVAEINLTEDSLQKSLTIEDIDDELDSEVQECVQWMNSKGPIYNRKYEDLGQGPERPLPLVQKPPELELKSLPAHLRYAFLGEKETLPVIVSSSLSNEEMEKLLQVLRTHKLAIGWTLVDIQGISPSTVMHKILMEDDSKPSIEAQRRLNPAMKEVVRKDILKWLDAGVIYPISDSSWVSPVQVVPKKGGITVVKNDNK